MPAMARGRAGTMLAALLCAAVLCVFEPAANAATSAFELGPAVPLTEPSGGYVGKLKLSPSHGPARTPVAGSGEGVSREQEFQLVLRQGAGHRESTPAP